MAICAIDEYWLSAVGTGVSHLRLHFQAPEIAVEAVVGADALSGRVQYYPLSIIPPFSVGRINLTH
jgi:hypothetical protein